MGDTKEKIIFYLEKTNKKVTKNNLIRAFASSEIEKEEVLDIVNELEEKGIIYIDDFENCHTFTKNCDLVQDKLRKNDNNKYFIHNNGNNIFITNDALNGALINDIVLVNKNDGNIKKIVKRNTGKLILECKTIDNEITFIPIKDYFEHNIFLNKKNYFNFNDGDRIIVKIKSGNSKDGFYCDFIKNIGHKDDPDIETKMFLYEKDIPIDFNENVIKETEQIPNYVKKEDFANRLDLRDKRIFTIDGISTKDFDDAVSIEMNENGNYLLGVHIADVAHYVKPGTAIFNEAFNRGTSIYITNFVIPMLPRKLSNGICSLNPNEERLTISCIMEINKNGQVIDYKIHDSVIKSKMRMIYEDVNKVIDGYVVEDYEYFKKDLVLMHELSLILNDVNEKRGYLDFGNNDIKIEIDNNGTPIDVKTLDRGPAEKLIENFMILANETVSKDISWKGLPCIYRVHDMPPVNSITSALSTIESLKSNIKKPNNFNSQSIQNLIKKMSALDEKDILLMILLTGMSKASYSPNNIGHFGLALDYYSHFTSPIRRFPDLMLHTLIKEYNTIYNVDNINERINYITENLTTICQDNSYKERRAESVEREFNEFKKAEYMKNHITETFSGIVTYVSKKGITIVTKNHITGHIKINDLIKEGFKYIPGKCEIISNDKKTSYRFGSPIEVTVKSINNCCINFCIKKEEQKVLVKHIS